MNTGAARRLNLRPAYGSGGVLDKLKLKRRQNYGHRSNDAPPMPTVRHRFYPTVGVDTAKR
ncbi:hypothetical protein HC928_22720 [bacterium]|nr:hypothetical protein [bacterium]